MLSAIALGSVSSGRFQVNSSRTLDALKKSSHAYVQIRRRPEDGITGRRHGNGSQHSSVKIVEFGKDTPRHEPARAVATREFQDGPRGIVACTHNRGRTCRVATTTPTRFHEPLTITFRDSHQSLFSAYKRSQASAGTNRRPSCCSHPSARNSDFDMRHGDEFSGNPADPSPKGLSAGIGRSF